VLHLEIDDTNMVLARKNDSDLQQDVITEVMCII
jgi:hypothetical protein